MLTFAITWVQILGLLVGIILPLIVALVTKDVTSSSAKAILLAALSVIVSLLTEIQAALANHTSYNIGTALLTALGTFVVAVAMHFGFFQPTTITAKLQAIGSHRK